MNHTKGGLVIFTANSHPSSRELGKRIAERLGVELGKVQVYQEANRETRVQIQESVRGKDVFVIQTVSKDVNTTIMEMLIMVYACRTSCAKSITGVLPYFPYSKQCKMRKRGSIVSKLIASMMCKAGLTHLITMDLHQKEIQGFFNIPVDNLRASPFLLQYIQEEIPDYRNAVIVAKSPASAKRAQSFAERLRLGIAVIHGEAQDAESDQVDGRHSPPTVKTTGAIHPSMEIPCKNMFRRLCEDVVLRVSCLFPVLIPKEKPPITVVGDVGGRIAIIVDDIIDDVDSFVAAAETLKERGAYKIFVMATHGILSSEAPRFIEESAIDEVVVTNTIPHELQKLQCPKIKTVDISMILSEAIRRIHNGESMSYLFRNIGVDD
ncbi:phosphoribosyl pyrophosphate synthase-associated protein 2 isoform X1 [Synchiropus splendidus]|uniref:phosphoribosyl pyrophosphate synthase-associated protein 2 isoform X1 n=1 Tax=Synchiropus splendidus TaxID=270530 RepID=UPI00237DADFD|nr:phosphoribosyl pyrophosphate synthase-associated protein 2 isoform X1 [Synchiropus splendidus]